MMTQESEFVIKLSNEGREAFRITPDRKVIVSEDIYNAARDFWNLVRQMAPSGWSVEVDGPPVGIGG